VTALRELDEHPDTIFTVLTGEGRFFSSGADVKGSLILSCLYWFSFSFSFSRRRKSHSNHAPRL
jgi:enoyl-CoA hydratase/carnithine racemase